MSNPAPAEPAASEPSADAPPRGVVFRADGTRFAPEAPIKIEPVDFRNPTFLAEGEMRRLRANHQDYLRALYSRLSNILRSEIALNLGKFGTMPCESFIEGLKTPSQISIFRVHPLNGVGYIDIPPKLAVAFTTRILGGRESTAAGDQYLTEIETALLEDVIAIITAEWCEQWRDDMAMSPQLIGHETNPRFIHSSGKGAMMLVVGIEVSFGRAMEIIQIAVPLTMIEPMVKRMSAARARETGVQRPDQSQASWRNSYDEIAIPVNAEITAASMTVQELLNLKVGEMIELSASVLETAQIKVAGVVRFTAHAGQQDGYAAVRITDKVALPKK